MATYDRFYSGGWEDIPSRNTPINHEALNHIEDGVKATADAVDALPNTYLPFWQPNTAYTSGQRVVNPSGQTVTANSSFTSGASYNASNWTVVAGGGATVTQTDNGDGTITLVAG